MLHYRRQLSILPVIFMILIDFRVISVGGLFFACTKVINVYTL